MQVENVEGQNVIYVIVQFPSKWVIDEENATSKGVTIGVGQDYPGQYYFCAEMEKGFDVVFDVIEENIKKMETAEERVKLLRQKIEKLQQLFMDESIPIESLRALEFEYKLPPKKFTKSKKKEENIYTGLIDGLDNSVVNEKPEEVIETRGEEVNE